MSDVPRLPDPPAFDTIPAPPDEDLVAMIRELRGALEGVCLLAVKLDTKLAQVMLAELTVEHKTNVLTERADRADERLRALEQATAAE